MSYCKKNKSLYVCILLYINVTMTDVKNVNEITQQTNNNNTDTSSNNQQQNTSKQILLGCDVNQDDEAYQSTVADILTQAGYNVKKLAIEPNAYATASYDSSSKGKIGIYLIAAGTNSIGDAYEGNTYFDYNYFGIRPEASPDWDVSDFDTKPIGSDADARGGVTDKIAGKSFKEINEIVKSKCMCVTGKDANEMGANLVAAIGGQVSNSTPAATTGGAVKIPDPTFYGLIKQIIGGIDGSFTVANNMAYLLGFEDFFKYRDKYNEYIPIIEPSDVLLDSVEHNWATNGYYNNVEITYADGILEYGYDSLIKQHGKNTFYYNFSQDDYETAKSKAQALLSAHIRDYSTDIQLKIFYNENITTGSWVKLHKSLTKINGKTRREQKQEDIKIKRKGITISNITQEILQDKIIHHLIDEKGNKIDIEGEKSDYDLFFVQGYYCRWNKDNSLIMDIQLKYGPDTPNDPVNASIGTINGANSASSGGLYGNDTFTISDICVANNDMILGRYEGGAQVQKVKELVNSTYMPEPEDYKPRANQNSNYAKKYSQMKSPAEVYAAFRSEYKYSRYEDNCSCWKNATDFYDNAGKTANCGDTTCLLKVFFDCIGVPSCGVHIDGHYFNAIQINGTWEIIDGVRYENQTCNFPDGNGYSFGNPYPCDSYKSNGGN